MTDAHPRVSVIVPTRNNLRTIEACLRSVHDQTHPAVELIVVDNDSDDGTWQVAQRLADTALRGGPERSAQRNLGIEHATGAWVLWLDSDMILPRDSVRAAVTTALRTGADGVALPERTIGDGFWTACRALERECYLDQPWLHNPRLVRRELLTGEQGFDLRMSGPEDADLRMRMRAAGRRIELAPIVVDHDEGRLTVSDVLRKRYYYGRSIPAFASEHDGAVGAQGRALLQAYAAHRTLLLRRPAHAAGMVALRGLEVVGYALGAWKGRADAAATARESASSTS